MMNSVDLLLVKNALRNVESALANLPDNTDLGVFKARLDLIAARGDLRAALIGNETPKVDV